MGSLHVDLSGKSTELSSISSFSTLNMAAWHEASSFLRLFFRHSRILPWPGLTELQNFFSSRSHGWWTPGLNLTSSCCWNSWMRSCCRHDCETRCCFSNRSIGLLEPNESFRMVSLKQVITCDLLSPQTTDYFNPINAAEVILVFYCRSVKVHATLRFSQFSFYGCFKYMQILIFLFEAYYWAIQTIEEF